MTFIFENIRSIVSSISILIIVVSTITNVLVLNPIERISKTLFTLFLDYMIKKVLGSLIIISATSLLGKIYYPLLLVNGNEKIIFTIVLTFIVTIFAFMIGLIQYLFFTYKKSKRLKKTRWCSSVLILLVVLLGDAVVSGYFWHINEMRVTLVYMGFSTLLMTFILSGLNLELILIHKNRHQYVLRMKEKIDISSLPTQIYHTQTISKESQVFEPPYNYNNPSKTYYVLYPREQFALKYTWDKE